MNHDWQNCRYLTIQVPFTDAWLIEKQKIDTAEVRLDDGRTISAEQRKKAYATIKDISNYTGYAPEECKEVMKYLYIEETGEPYFSFSDCNMTTARLFITYLIDFCLRYNVPCRDALINRCEDVGHYLYSCLINKRCCLCGKPCDIHHAENSRVGMGRDRTEIAHAGLYAFALCREHHAEAHTMPEKEFCNKYHVFSIRIDEEIAKKYKLKE
jgi:hypothetical protein